MDQSQTLNDILESVQFLRDHAASKEDLKSFATKEDLKSFATKEDLKSFATKEDLENVKNEILTQLDGFVVLYQNVNIEVVATKSLYRRLDTNVTGMAKFVHYPLPV